MLSLHFMPSFTHIAATRPAATPAASILRAPRCMRESQRGGGQRHTNASHARKPARAARGRLAAVARAAVARAAAARAMARVEARAAEERAGWHGARHAVLFTSVPILVRQAALVAHRHRRRLTPAITSDREAEPHASLRDGGTRACDRSVTKRMGVHSKCMRARGRVHARALGTHGARGRMPALLQGSGGERRARAPRDGRTH